MIPMIYLSVLETEEDRIKFGQIYTEYKQDMYAIAFDILKNKEDAEDAVHQSFLKIADVFTKISHLPCNELKSYIVIVSRNTAINMYNKNKYRAERTAELQDDLPDPDYEYSQENYAELVESLKQLPQMYKDVLFLYYLEGFSSRKIAAQLGITPNTVRQRVARARIMLKQIMERGNTDE